MNRGHNFLKVLILFSSMIIGAKAAWAQDLIFSQYYNSPLHLNPAFAGTTNYPQFTANYRMQWPQYSTVYETYAVTYDQFFKKMNSGIGFIAIADDQGNGILKTTKFAGIYSYRAKFRNDWQMKFGMELGFHQNRLDWDKLIFSDQIDRFNGPFDSAGVPFPSSEQPPDSFRNGFLDINLGMLLYNPRYYIGVSLDHVNGAYSGFIDRDTPNSSESLPVLYMLNAGFQLVLQSDNKGNPKTFISPNVLFAFQSGFSQINLGAYLQRDQLFGGLWLRHTINNVDAIIFSAGVDLHYIKIGYSFDLTTSDLGIETGGSHEIGISVGLRNLEKKESKYNDCFSLFR